MDSGPVERLANVNIAEAGDDALIEKEELDRRSTTLKALLQVANVEVQRFRTERLERGPFRKFRRSFQVERPETPRIVERDPPPLVRLDDEMVVLLDLGRIDAPAPGHSEVEDEGVTAVRVDQPVFGPAPKAGHARPRKALTEIDRHRSAQIRPTRLDACNPMSLEHAFQAANGGLDFGKLWHRAAIWRTAAKPARGARPMSDQVNFGDELVSPEEKTRRVGAVFSSVARRYDVMNDLMSAGMHRLWKDRFVNRVKPRSGEHILDMAGGTGDIAFRMVRRGARVTVSDINADMLEVGKQRAGQLGLTGLEWKVENAETLTFGDGIFDAYTIVFGIRNVTDIPAALREAHRVLKRGGRFYCMEFSSSDWPGFANLYEAWASSVIPRIGKVIADDEASYRYLVESIRRFPRPEAFRRMVAEAGFVRASAEPMLGGLVTIHSGWKI